MADVSLQDALELSDRLEKRGMEQQRAFVDFHAFGQYKAAAISNLPPAVDAGLMTKLAAVIKLDDVLVDEFNKSASAEDRETAKACLMLNRRRGVAILKQVLR